MIDLKIFIFIFGSMIGSFLNVLIVRLPLGKDWVKERSCCPKCQKPIYWYHNIPFVGFLILRGVCYNCKERISLQYPLVELFTGLGALFLIKYLKIQNGFWLFGFYFTTLSIFIVHFFIDLKHKILPNGLNLILGLLFLVYALAMSFPLSHWLLGFGIGLFFPLSITWLFYKLRGKIGLGGGDIKLFAVLGIMLGPVGIIQNIFFSSFLGAIIGSFAIIFKKLNRNNPLSFGPFILFVACFQIYFPELWNKMFSILIL